MKINSINKKFVFLASVIPIVYSVLVLSNWIPLKITGILGPRKFMDLNWVLVSAQCDQKEASDIYASFNGDLCTGYIYGKPLINAINLLEINPALTNMIGIALSFLVALSLFLITYFSLANTNNSKHQKLAIITILISPGFWLLLERGNIDSLILIMIFLAAYAKMYSREKTSIILITITALFKFYTLPLIYITHHYSRSQIRWLAFVSSLLVGAYSVQTVISIPKFPATWYVSFGSPSLGLYYNLAVEHLKLPLPLVPNVVAQIVGVAIIFGFVFVLLKKITIQTYSDQESDRINLKIFNNLFLFFGSLHSICFVAGMNYDYRLSFASIALVSLINVIRIKVSSRYFIAASVLSMWLSCFNFGLQGFTFVVIQFLGDLLLYPITAYIIAALIRSKRIRL
jgi:hypothetical protein